MTVHKTIQEERIRKAQEMLTTTSLAVNKISELCCYRTTEYFDAIFTKKNRDEAKKLQAAILYALIILAQT